MILDISENQYERRLFESLEGVFDPFWNKVDVFVEDCIMNNYPINPVVLSYEDGLFTVERGENILETVYASKKAKVHRAVVDVIIVNLHDKTKEDIEFIKKYLKVGM